MDTGKYTYEVALKTVTVRAAEPQEREQRADRPENAAPILRAIFDNLSADQEHLVALMLDGHHQVLGFKVASSGTERQTLCDPRPILRDALLMMASGVILAHNHPAGDLVPSQHDITLTRRMLLAGEATGIPLIDHLIVTADGRWMALRSARPDVFAQAACP